ncbi:MAG: S8 family serine peptidase [Betaproteobacteria bacterium]|nr:S8 family serine peptidase [Betaproteobacteria bacterium]
MPDATTPPPGVTEQLIEYLSFGARTLADTKNTVVGLFGDRADQVSIFNFSIGTDYAAPAVVDEFRSSHLATAWGTQHLRNGLGAIYLQSAGNEQLSMDKGVLPDGTQLSVNCSQVLKADSALLGGVISNSTALTCGSSNHEPAGKPYLYQVASIASSGRASSYSSSAAANWMTGFGGEFGTTEPAIISTDNSGCQSGANNVNRKTVLEAYVGEFLFKLIADLFGTPGSKDVNCNYTGTMNGTSAAAPSVSGVTALMLEANPQLTWQDVGYIFAKTARKVDAEIASGSRAVTFTPNGGEPWNLDVPGFVMRPGLTFRTSMDLVWWTLMRLCAWRLLSRRQRADVPTRNGQGSRFHGDDQGQCGCECFDRELSGAWDQRANATGPDGHQQHRGRHQSRYVAV